MGLLSSVFKKNVSEEPQKPAAAPAKSADVPKTTETTKKEVKPVVDKITVGHIHMSGCTGCLVSLADNYGGLLTILDRYADLVYGLTLADVRHIPKMDVALVEGSVCINDKLSVEEIKQTREKAAVVVAVGGLHAAASRTSRHTKHSCRSGTSSRSMYTSPDVRQRPR
jgi:coenzyme F420 hydrogenase subunit gamma